MITQYCTERSEERRMTDEERADVLNAIQEAVDKYGLIVTGYDDHCNMFEVVMMVTKGKDSDAV